MGVGGYIGAKSGQVVPSSQIRAGKRVKIENYLQDLSGTGLTFLISMIECDDRSETVAISTGLPDNLAVFLARISAGLKLSSSGWQSFTTGVR